MASKSVLVVDDDDDLRESLCMVLQSQGYPIFQATNGREAIETLNKIDTPPGLIILDMIMDEMNGKQFLQYVRQSYPQTHAKIPVLISTGADQVEAEQSPVVGVLKKPLDLSALFDTVKAFCS